MARAEWRKHEHWRMWFDGRLVRYVDPRRFGALGFATAAGGTSFHDFAGVAEDAGYFARELRVYERDGQPCRRCGAAIRRTVDTGRSTYWCAGCQR